HVAVLLAATRNAAALGGSRLGPALLGSCAAVLRIAEEGVSVMRLTGTIAALVRLLPPALAHGEPATAIGHEEEPLCRVDSPRCHADVENDAPECTPDCYEVNARTRLGDDHVLGAGARFSTSTRPNDTKKLRARSTLCATAECVSPARASDTDSSSERVM